jgi:hypothetical protein
LLIGVCVAGEVVEGDRRRGESATAPTTTSNLSVFAKNYVPDFRNVFDFCNDIGQESIRDFDNNSISKSESLQKKHSILLHLQPMDGIPADSADY